MEHRILKIDPQDNVGVATTMLEPGIAYGVIGTETVITARMTIEFGHKVALKDFSPGQEIVKYGEVIGFALGAIEQGDHIHTHNLKNAI